MDSLKKKEKNTPTSITNNTSNNMPCTNPCCFFCTMKEQDSTLRKSGIAKCFKNIPLTDDHEHVLVLSGLWNIAMTHPDDPEFPSLGIFECMASLIRKGVTDRDWLVRDQNIYIPYYAAHVIGSYTMNKPEFAEIAVQSGVIPPLMELLRGKLSWVEQRVAVRAIGHLASYERIFEQVAAYEDEVVKLAMQLASTCLEEVYVKFVGVKDKKKRLKYHSDLLTRGVGGMEMENRKAEEWASQLQCWCLYLLNCFAFKERSLHLICNQDRGFLKDLCNMWGGLANHSSPAGVGLIRILCYSKVGRKSIAETKEVVESLCNLSRSSDDWQYMGIDCLLLLLKDKDTRYKVLETAVMHLVDLVELKTLGDRTNLGESITEALVLHYKKHGKRNFKDNKVAKALQEIWDLKVERRKREKTMSHESIEDRRVLVSLIKRQGNHAFWVGDVETAVAKYSEALEICPVRFRKERMVIYSNRAQCRLMLRDPDAAIGDATRALCLAVPANSHGKSLWRRSQAYDMKGLAKESLMDCVMFVNGCVVSDTTKRVKIPYHAARMISKQMDATWLFASARSKISARTGFSKVNSKLVDEEKEQQYREMMRMIMEKKGIVSGLSTIVEEPVVVNKEGNGRKLERVRRRRKVAVARSM